MFPIPLFPQTLENTAIYTVFFNVSMFQCRWPTQTIYTKNHSKTLFFKFYNVFTMFSVKNNTFFGIKSVQNTVFGSVFNALASKNPSKYRYLHCLLIFVRFPLPEAYQNDPKFHFNTLLSSDTQKSSKNLANTTYFWSRCETVFGPPAKADIATAILTNVIEHLVWLFAPQ